MYEETRGITEITYCSDTSCYITISDRFYDQLITAIDTGRKYLDVEDEFGAEGRVYLEGIIGIFKMSVESRNEKMKEKLERDKMNSLT